AMNLAALGIDVTLIGAVGADDAATTLRGQLERANVRAEFVELDRWPTIVKVRVVSRRQQMLRIDFEQPLVADIAARLEQLLTVHIDRANVVVIEDYDKGTLARPRRLIEIARARGKRVVVDPKFKSFDEYRGADVVKPNVAEFARAAGAWTDDDDFV